MIVGQGTFGCSQALLGTFLEKSNPYNELSATGFGTWPGAGLGVLRLGLTNDVVGVLPSEICVASDLASALAVVPASLKVDVIVCKSVSLSKLSKIVIVYTESIRTK